jgi:hypothetical protein
MTIVRILFLHHSTGGLLLRFTRVRKLLKEKAPNIELWDHGYNLSKPYLLSRLFGQFNFRTGLSDATGKMTGIDYNITISNNSPREYAEIFSRDPSDSTLSQILSYDLIIFKNCFPASKIISESQLIEYQNYYQIIFNSLAKYPQKQFILFTPPPLRREMTHPDWAFNARKLSSWLVTHHTNNVKVFNFFDLLSDREGSNANMLRRDYCNVLPFDSHPNIRANRLIGPLFVKTINNSTKESH